MAEVRCPMCSSPNPDIAEECSVCGARLTPLVADSSPSAPQGEPSIPANGEDLGADWLDKIRSEVGSPTPEQPDEEATGDAGTDPDWLNQLREADSSEDEGPPEGEIPDWMEEFSAAGESSDQEEEVPEWLARIRARKASAPDAAPGEEAQENWLDELRTDEEAVQPSPEGLEGLEPSPKQEEEPEIGEPAAALDLGALSEFPAVPGSPEEGDSGAFRRPEGVFGIEADPSVTDDQVLEQESGEPPDSEDHVPALVMGEPGEKPVVEIDDLSLESIELPDWIGEMRPESGAEADESDLAPATLPTWLEAMRPVDTFRSDIEIEPEEVQPVESAGPLAGLRGVLMAEPVVAMPRTPTTSATRLEVTERQYAQAELIHRLVEQEQREMAIRSPERIRVPLIRWVVALVLCIAVTLPLLFQQLGFEGFAPPAVVPRDLGPLITLVETVPTDQPMLVVFDYAPGYSAELGAVSSPLLTHAAQRAIPIVTLSTQPTGPPLAELMIQNVEAGRELVNGIDYAHLGYLSGGPTAVQLFAIAPRDVLLRGFQLPEGFEGTSGWDAPILQNVNRLSDFGSVVVITAGTETARTWAEQTNPWIGESPLIMVLSAGAEPLVRPYFESPTKQVDGILTGLPSAVAYEQLNNTLGSARTAWNAFGVGMIVIELILFAGIIYGVVVWLSGSQRTGRGRESA